MLFPLFGEDIALVGARRSRPALAARRPVARAMDDAANLDSALGDFVDDSVRRSRNAEFACSAHFSLSTELWKLCQHFRGFLDFIEYIVSAASLSSAMKTHAS